MAEGARPQSRTPESRTPVNFLLSIAMIVSWKWLQDYISLSMTPDKLAERLAMSGLNHEGHRRDRRRSGNRPGGHQQSAGLSWATSVWRGKWESCGTTRCRFPDPQPEASGPAIAQLAQVRVDCPALCPRYTARVIQGVQVGPSPGVAG